MKHRTFLLTAVLISAAGLIPSARAGRVIYTTKSRFGIPYRSDSAEIQRLRAREIRLFLSNDRGRTWSHAQTVAPEAGRFQFNAPRDGLYSFAVRTVSADGRTFPAQPVGEPELEVVVDTQSPTVSFKLAEAAPGRVQLSWTLDDANLDAATLKLEYLQSGAAAWQPVAIRPQATGATSWATPAGGFVAVRGTVQDRAGNVGTGNASTEVRAATANGVGTVPGPFPRRSDVASTGNASSNQGAFTPSPQPGHRIEVSPNRHGGLSIVPNGGSARGPAQAIDPGPSRVLGPSAPTAVRVQRSTASAGRTRFVGTRKFQIGYAIDDIGPSGVSHVELYISQDGGTKWYRYGVDADKISPFDVFVPREGTYGFQIRVKSGVGLADPPPQPGDKPDTIVRVDLTPPSVQLLPVQQGRGQSMNKLLVRWTLDDEQLADKPVALSYAQSREGPWQPIGSWMRNSGSFVWTVQAGLPDKLYLRITARDAAGNMARAETPQAVIVDLSRPRARIVDVEPVATRR